MKPTTRVAVCLLALSLLFATGPSIPPVAAASRSVTLVAYDSFAPSKGIFDDFTKRTGIKVKVVTAGDGGELVNKAILTKDAPLGDVLWGVDNTFLSRALTEKIFVDYVPAGRSAIDKRFRTVAGSKAVTPVDYGDVCVNFDRAALAKAGVAAPKNFDDLALPRYRGMLVVENPATSSPGLAFLLGTITRYGRPAWRGYWAKLRANGVKVVDGWDAAYNTEFSAGGGGGKRPLVVSYGSSPPAAVLFGPDPKASVSPIGVAAGTCFRQIEFAGVLRNAKHQPEARALIDELIGPRFQADLALSMFVYPVRSDVALPPLFTKFAVVPAKPATMTPADIARGRDGWIDEWTDLVL